MSSESARAPEAVALRDELLASLPGPPADVVAASPASGLLGRDDELAGFERVLDQAEAGQWAHRPAVGSSGRREVGPARRDARARRAARVPHRAGVAAAFEGAWPYAPVLEAFADLARRHPTLLDGLDDSFRAEIERALAGADLDWSGDGGHQRLFVAAGELLRLAAAGSGLLFTIDDVQEADEASLRFLHYLARCSLGEQVVLVLASRDGVGATTAPAFERVRASLLSRNAADEVVARAVRPRRDGRAPRPGGAGDVDRTRRRDLRVVRAASRSRSSRSPVSSPEIRRRRASPGRRP